MSIGPIFREVADKFNFVEISTLAIQLQIRRDSNPATVTPLLRWLSTKHNLIDLAKKAFPAMAMGGRRGVPCCIGYQADQGVPI